MCGQIMFEEKAIKGVANSRDKSMVEQDVAAMMLQKARCANASLFSFYITPYHS